MDVRNIVGSKSEVAEIKEVRKATLQAADPDDDGIPPLG